LNGPKLDPFGFNSLCLLIFPDYCNLFVFINVVVRRKDKSVWLQLDSLNFASLQFGIHSLLLPLSLSLSLSLSLTYRFPLLTVLGMVGAICCRTKYKRWDREHAYLISTAHIILTSMANILISIFFICIENFKDYYSFLIHWHPLPFEFQLGVNSSPMQIYEVSTHVVLVLMLISWLYKLDILFEHLLNMPILVSILKIIDFVK
jgi:hypothetical protein